MTRNRPKSNMNYRHRVRNLASELIAYKQLKLTLPKARQLQKHFERLITLAKSDTLSHRRVARNMIIVHHPPTIDPLKELFRIAQRYQKRSGGYTRILKLGLRAGDNAPLVSIQLV